MFHIFVYIPETHLEPVKDAMFAAGAGQVGAYDRCAWQVRGDGQFRPLGGSEPHIGERDELTTVSEYRVEMVCPQDVLQTVIADMKAAHPYEEVAYGVVALQPE